MSSVLVVTFAFLTECAPQAAAGAMALENMLRNPAAAIASVITPPLIAKMGAGWFFSGFGFLCVLSVGIGSLCARRFLSCLKRPSLADVFSVLSLYGPYWRENSAIALRLASAAAATPRPVTKPTSASSKPEKSAEV